jgi:hypothetical protein
VFKTRLSLTELESRETPSGAPPLDPGGTAPNPSIPAQTAPVSPTPNPVAPPLDPYGSP